MKCSHLKEGRKGGRRDRQRDSKNIEVEGISGTIYTHDRDGEGGKGILIGKKKKKNKE